MIFNLFDQTYTNTSLTLVGVIVTVMLLAFVLLLVAQSLAFGPDGVT